MKKVLLSVALALLTLTVTVFAQSGGLGGVEGIAPPQYMNILSPTLKTEIGCCVAPFNKVWIDRQSPIVWVNWSGMDVRLKFGKGEKCEEVTEARLAGNDLRINMSCYIAALPKGKKLTMRLTEPGLYDYTVEFQGEVSPRSPKTESGTFTVF